MLDANRFGIPVIIRKSFAGSGYKCASIRHVSFTCRYFCGFVQAGAPTTCKLFRINYWKPKTFHQTHKNPPTQQFFCTNPPQYAILISINKRTLVPTYTERKDYDNQSGNVNFLSVGFINCLSPCFLRIPCEIRGRKKYACQSN